jgi:catalase
MANTIKGTIKSRKIAILAMDGVDAQQVAAIKAALAAAGGQPELISKLLGTISSADQRTLPVDKTLLTAGSIMYDAVYVPGGRASVEALLREGDAVHFVMEAYKHAKAIAATGEGVQLLTAAGLAGPASNGARQRKAGLDQAGIVSAERPTALDDVAKRFVEAIGQHRFFSRQQERVPA